VFPVILLEFLHANCWRRQAVWTSWFLAIFLACFSVPRAYSVDADLLWLPREYNHHYQTLYRAAIKVEQHQRCVKVIAASLSESDSNIEHPVFKIT